MVVLQRATAPPVFSADGLLAAEAKAVTNQVASLPGKKWGHCCSEVCGAKHHLDAPVCFLHSNCGCGMFITPQHEETHLMVADMSTKSTVAPVLN